MAITPPIKLLSPNKNQFRRYKDVPIIGDWISRIGRVQQILSNPCAVTPEIWVYAAFYAVPTMMLYFAKGSPTDYIAERAGRANRKKKKFKVALTPTDLLKGQGFGQKGEPQWVVFRSFILVRATGYYMTIADMTTAGAVIWTSTAYRWSGCTAAGNLSAWAQGHLVIDSVELPGAGDVFINQFITDGAQIIAMAAGTIAVPSSQIASVSFGLTSKPNEYGLPDSNWTARLIRWPEGYTVATADIRKEGAGVTKAQGMFYNGFSTNRVANETLRNGSYRILVTKGPGVIQWAGGFMSATGSPMSDAITPDP